MNKSAVALAADSLVTISREGTSEKTYNVNKLFTLSKYHPVGVMVYDNADLLGVPWETIIKEYRSNLSNRSFPKLKDYLEDFLNFVGRSRKLFPAKLQKNHFFKAACILYTLIKDQAIEQIKALTTDGKKIAKEKIKQVMEERIQYFYDLVQKHERIPNLEKEFESKLLKSYSSEITKARETVFEEKWELSLSSKRKLKNIIAESYSRKVPPLGRSGVVVAGFGESEIFPGACTVSVHGVLRNHLLYNDEENRSHYIDGMRPNDSAVLPFAQTDVVATFLRGIHPRLHANILEAVQNLLNDIPKVIKEHFPGNRGKKAVDDFTERNKQAVQNFVDELEKHIHEEHVSPLLDVVSFLPKDELAATAAALVELTSIKRKISRGMETVGGPVDVAVISKGDGFVWISRKHYFNPELNFQFKETYFRK